MSEYLNFSPEEDYPELGFNVATTVVLQDSTELLLGHTLFGDFRLQVAPSEDNPRPHQLQVYHSVEPVILAHVVMQIIQSNPSGTVHDIIEDILAQEQNLPVGTLRYPGRSIDESVDRQYHKVSSQLRRLLANGTHTEVPSLGIGHEGSLEGHLYHHTDGILITDEAWDDSVEIELEDDFKLEDLPRLETEIIAIHNNDLPAFAAALIATARTDYGRVKHDDMVGTLRSVV